MANFGKGKRNGQYWQRQSVYTPSFVDLEKYLPKPKDSDLPAFTWKTPKQSTVIRPTEYKSNNYALYNDRSSTNSNSSTSKCTNTATSSDHAAISVNVTNEQRTISLSHGKTLNSLSRESIGRRPPKRRHHSTVTPDFQDEVITKRVKRYYSTSQATCNNTARSLRFQQFEVEPPVFTLETLTQEIQEETLKCVQTVETLQKKLKLKSFLERTLSPFFPGCSLHLCGSSSNGFGGNTSDADFCLILKHLQQSNNRKEALPILRKIQRVLDNDPKNTFLSRCAVIPASVPILKFKDMISGCECDININNIVGLRNTHLLRAYCGVDYRVQPLVMLVKRWAKTHNINDASLGTLSSYALALMVIHYLQGVCKPAVVPVLQRQYPALFRYTSDFSSLLALNPCKSMVCNQSENRQSIGELFIGFFKYYAADFSWSTDYISIALGAAYPRDSQRKRKLVCVEEPFDGNNVAKAVCSVEKFENIKMKFRLAWHTLNISPSLESIKVT